MAIVLTQRQQGLLRWLAENGGQYHSAATLAATHGISVRTVKSEIAAIRLEIKHSPALELTSLPSKGYQLIIHDPPQAAALLDRMQKTSQNTALNEQPIRIKTILLNLLDHSGYVRKRKLQTQLNISDSTLYLDLKAVRKILNKYNLELAYCSGSGYRVEGRETDKRTCLAREDIYSMMEEAHETQANLKRITDLKELLVEIFLENEYKISEVLLESLILHLLLTLQRIERGYFIEPGTTKRNGGEKETRIAGDILRRCTSVPVSRLSEEINYLAVNLRGKRDYDDYSGVSEEINAFIMDSLEKIHVEYGVDFTRSIDLKIALALHFVPLLSRMQNNRQLKNVLLTEIKQTFPFAFDIANYFSLLIDDHYHVRISEDEAAYFTLYFNYGLENITMNSEGKKILVISRLKPSETILLRQKIDQWFRKQLLQLDFVNPLDLSRIDPGAYDALFTTETKDTVTRGAAVRISLFPSEKDFAKMNLAINGYDSVDSILSRFSSDLFWRGQAKNRQEIVARLIAMASRSYHLPKKFEELVLEREKLSSTYFGSQVAMPHPLYPITAQTFIAVAVLDKPVAWTEDQKVRIVLLVSTEMNNPKAFQLWPYLSSLISSPQQIHEILRESTYENFIAVFRAALLDKF